MRYNNEYAHEIHRYLWANYNQFNGNNQTAAGCYKQLLTATPTSVYVHKGYIPFLYQHNKYKEIVALKDRLGNTFNQDPEIQLIIVDALRKTGNESAADELVLTLSQRIQDSLEIVYEAAKIYLQRKELTNAHECVTRHLNSNPKRIHNCILYFVLAQIEIQRQEFSKALTYVQECLALNPYFDKGWLLQAAIKEQTGNLEGAIEGYTHYVQYTPVIDPIVQGHLISLQLKERFLTTRFLYTTKATLYQQAHNAFGNKQYTEARIAVDACLKKDPFDIKTQLLKIDILSATKEYDTLLSCIQQWLEQRPGDKALLAVLHLLSKTDTPKDKIIALLEHHYTNHPYHELVALYLADIHLRASNHLKARTYFETVFQKTTNSPLKKDVAFQLARLHYIIGDHAPLVQYATECINDGVCHAGAHNLLAYYYTEHAHDIGEAEKHCSLALSAEPDNIHFLDTKAVILCAQKEYTKAIEILKPIAQKEPHDPTILSHLAHAYEALGNHADAEIVRTTLSANHQASPRR